jgi:AcrR family transcriptional regulator
MKSFVGQGDVLVTDLAMLGADPSTTLLALKARVGASVAVVTYHYGNRRVLQALVRAGARLLRGPVQTGELRRAVVDELVARQAIEISDPQTDPPPLPKLGRSRLEELMNHRSDLDCECPNQVASIVLALQEFEAYSRRCVNTSPEDAELHRHLADGTGWARERMERLLAAVCAHDGIDL